MDYWSETMQDDVYLIAADGWVEAAKPRAVVEDKERKIKETPDLTVGRKKYKMDLVPPALIVARYFAEEQSEIDELQTALDNASRELEEFVEEHSSEEGLLADALNDKGKITRTGVKERLKAIEVEEESDEEREALTQCLALIEAQSKAGAVLKEAQVALDAMVLAKYGELTEAEIKTLVIEDKWFASIREAIEAEVHRLTQHLAGRIRQLAERYVTPLPQLTDEVAELAARVDGHLKLMGAVWN